MFENRISSLRDRYERLLNNELIRRILRNAGYLFSASGISAVLSMVQGILAARLLGVAGFGILGTITLFTSVINRFASFRMGELVIKYVGQFHEQGDTKRAAAVFKVAALAEMLASIVAYALVFTLAPLGARFLAKDASTANWFAIYGLIILANLIMESSVGLLQNFDRFRRMGILNVIQSTATLTVIVIVYLRGGDMLGILGAYLLGKVIGAVGMTFAAIYEATRQWGGGWWAVPIRSLRPYARELIHFGVSTNISASLSLVNKDGELLWVSLLRNPVEAGYYKLALALTNLVQMPVSPLPQATYPELSREVARKNWGNVRYIVRQGSIMAGSYTLLATLFLAVFGRPLIRLVYKPEFLPAYPALLILLLGMLVANTFYWNRTALLAIGRPDFPTKVNLALAISKISGTLLLVPRFGYLMNAALLSGSYLFGVSVSVLKFRSEVNRFEHMPAGEAPQAGSTESQSAVK